MKDLLAAVNDCVSAFGSEKTFWIGYSGGLDSHVLLSLFHQLREHSPLRLKAVHIHHGLSPNADAWALHCEEICASFDIPFMQQKVTVQREAGVSLEESARDARYGVFESLMEEGDVLVTAHHEDDQAETMFLQLFRGAGLKGLSSMPAIKPFGKGWQARPLLSFNREALEKYAQSAALKWITDESNTNTQYARNFIRHDILSVLKSRWPTVTETISRSSAYCAEAQVLLEEFALDLWQDTKGQHPDTLSVKKLLSLSAPKQRLMLRTWIQQMGHPLPDTRKMETICQNVLGARVDRMPHVIWGNSEVRRYRDDIYVMKRLSAHDPRTSFTWTLPDSVTLPNIGRLSAHPVMSQGLSTKINQVTIKFRQGSESLRLPKQSNKSLKNLFQEWGVPPWERERLPLIFVEDQLAGAVGYGFSEPFLAKNDEQGYEIRIEKGTS